MSLVEQDVESRFNEIESFLNFIRAVERLGRASPTLVPMAVASPVLKASVFLLLYNVVESCVRSALGEVYGQVASEGAGFNAVTERFQALWLRQQLDTPVDTANHNTYLTIVSAVAGSVARSEVIALEARKLPVSGNLDANSIRLICAKHGIELRVSRWARGGAELETVKDQRNALAHGNKTFSECGRDYALSDLTRIFKQTRHFLRGYLKSVRRFSDSRGFAQ